MNNPDEDTAANQFGKGDKYFGICTLMATMPGLPMFGHGQIEGFTEKYGMEYKRAYWDEQPDHSLIDRHQWQIIPLIKQRYLFANVDNFYLYDFFTREGMVDENVFAYSNRAGDERSLVVYHNRFGDTSGWVRTSARFMDKKARRIRQVELSAGLDIPDKKDVFLIFRDRLNGLQYIRSCQEIAHKGLFVQMDAYRAHVFLDFQMVEDDVQGWWGRVHDHLNGRGAPDLHQLRLELPVRPVLQPLREIANAGYFKYLLDHKLRAGGDAPAGYLINEAENKLKNLIQGAARLTEIVMDSEQICRYFRLKLKILFSTQWLDEMAGESQSKARGEISTLVRQFSSSDIWLAQICWTFLDCLRSAIGKDTVSFNQLVRDWRLLEVVENGLWEMGELISSPLDAVRSIRFLLRSENWLKIANRSGIKKIAIDWVEDEFARDYLGINDYDGKTWFDQHRLGLALALLAYEGAYEIMRVDDPGTKKGRERLEKLAKMVQKFQKAAKKSAFEMASFLEEIS
jgi:hypothetical protein